VNPEVAHVAVTHEEIDFLSVKRLSMGGESGEIREVVHSAALRAASNRCRLIPGSSPIKILADDMNETLSLLNSHRSERSFSTEPVSDEALDAILEAARRAPTSKNSQHVSMVVVRDPARRARIAETAGGQRWIATAPVFIAVILDFYKTEFGVEMAGEKPVVHESMEGLLAGVTDVGIALATMMHAAHSLGLGIVPIGGIRRNAQAVTELLELPPHTFPVVGLVVGHVDKPAVQKPRLPMATFRHDERYHSEGIREAIAAYDETIMDYWKSIGRADGEKWSTNTAKSYRESISRPVKAAIEKQGITPIK
jgi:FMN reductase [NAD(P)H]